MAYLYCLCILLYSYESEGYKTKRLFIDCFFRICRVLFSQLFWFFRFKIYQGRFRTKHLVYISNIGIINFKNIFKKEDDQSVVNCRFDHLLCCCNRFWGEMQFQGEHIVLGSFLIFLSALTYASYLVGSGWLIPKFGVIAFTCCAMIVS